jgi:hypothetical protein
MTSAQVCASPYCNLQVFFWISGTAYCSMACEEIAKFDLPASTRFGTGSGNIRSELEAQYPPKVLLARVGYGNFWVKGGGGYLSLYSQVVQTSSEADAAWLYSHRSLIVSGLQNFHSPVLEFRAESPISLEKFYEEGLAAATSFSAAIVGRVRFPAQVS